MNRTLLICRIFFVLLSLLACTVFAYATGGESMLQIFVIGLGIAALVILTDISLEGFSLRGLSAVTFGLATGGFIAYLIGASPLFEPLESGNSANAAFFIRLVLYVVCMYLATVIALRGKDEFNLVIPYVRFSPENVEAPIAIADTSALIDGRLVTICESGWFGYALVIPRFVIDELHRVADSDDPGRRARGRRGLEVLQALRELTKLDLRIHESDVPGRDAVDAKLVYLAEALKAKLVTTDYNLAKVGEFHGVEWLSVTELAKALNKEICVGMRVTSQMVRAGKEAGQAVGYLSDGSMLVVNDGARHIGREVEVEIDSIVPTSGGKMVFGVVD